MAFHLPAVLAAIPTPLLIGVPLLGVAALVWYEKSKSDAAAAAAATDAASSPTATPLPSAPTGSLGPVSTPKIPAGVMNVQIPGRVMRQPGAPSFTNAQLAQFARTTASALPGHFSNDATGILRNMAWAALQAIQADPSAANFARTLASLASSANQSPDLATLVAHLRTFPVGGLL